MGKIKFILFLILVIVITGYISYWRGVNKPFSTSDDEVAFVVEQGESVADIGYSLKKLKLIRSDYFFTVYVKNSENQSKLQAGEYYLKPSMNVKEIVRILAGGDVIKKEIDFTIIEGWNINDIAKYFEKQDLYTADDVHGLVGTPMVDKRLDNDLLDQYDFLKDKPRDKNLEGYLFPDTYRIYENATLEEALTKMLNNFDNKLTPEMRTEIKQQDKTIFEIVTMASLIEKEVRGEDDMKIVSGIFWDRIKNGQALQSCATLAYILGENKPQYSLEDTEVESPYNTYQNQGLTPGPICNPSLKAIKAAIYPTYTDYNFFLNRPDTGETVFSVTYDEHIANKNKYLR